MTSSDSFWDSWLVQRLVLMLILIVPLGFFSLMAWHETPPPIPPEEVKTKRLFVVNNVTSTNIGAGIAKNRTYLPAIYKDSLFVNPNWPKRPKTTKYPLPAIVVGLPKAGTTTIHRFFVKAGFKTSHWKCQWQTSKEYCGTCVQRALDRNLPPLSSCGNFEVYTQLDYVGNESASDCVFPQISYLEEIHQEAPHATFVLNLRNLTHWARSVQNWKGLSERMLRCSCGPKSSSREDLIQWHLDQIERVHQFVALHPSHQLVVIDIEDLLAGEVLADAFGTNVTYWGHVNQNRKKPVV